MKLTDLQRCYYQYRRSIKNRIVRLNFFEKIVLVFIFPFILLSSLFDFKRRKNKKIWVVKYGKEPYDTINKLFSLNTSYVFLEIKKGFLLPKIFVRDFWDCIKRKPLFVITNIVFFAALALKISRYYYNVYKNNVYYLIVMQEYSFYMTYLTKVMESHHGKLYNIMHGIPGYYYSFFRFSKCFVWSDVFKKIYVSQGAEKNQFVVSGSIFHQYLYKIFNMQKNKVINKNLFDICYPLEGYVDGVKDVLNLLNKKKEDQKLRICIKQHPRYKVKINSLNEENITTINSIAKSKIIIAHYSTILLDALIFNKEIISYIKKKEYLKYVFYIPEECIVFSKEQLEKTIDDILKNKKQCANKIDIDSLLNLNNDAFKIIQKEIYLDIE